jgi:hypothetical protein
LWNRTDSNGSLLCFKQACTPCTPLFQISTERETRTLKMLILSQPRMPIPPFLLLVDSSGLEPEQRESIITFYMILFLKFIFPYLTATGSPPLNIKYYESICGSSKICTYSALKHLFYRQARLSFFGVLPILSEK